MEEMYAPNDESLHQSHDAFFCEWFSKDKYAIELAQLALGENANVLLDWSSFHLESTALSEAQGRKRQADLLCSVTLNKHQSPGRVYLLLEHKSHQDKATLSQLFEYQLLARRSHRGAVISSIVYHGREREWNGGSGFQDVFLKLHPESISLLNHLFAVSADCLVLNLRDDAVLERTGGLSCRVILYILSKIWRLDDERVAEAFRIGLTIESDEERTEMIRSVTRYIRRKYPSYDWQRLEQIERETIVEEKRIMAQVMTLAELEKQEYMKQGIEQGIERGIEQGYSDATRNITLNLIREGLGAETICKFTGLSLDDVKKLQNDVH